MSDSSTGYNPEAIPEVTVGIRELAINTSAIVNGLPDTGPRPITRHGEVVAMLIPLEDGDVEAGARAMAKHALDRLSGDVSPDAIESAED